MEVERDREATARKGKLQEGPQRASTKEFRKSIRLAYILFWISWPRTVIRVV